MATDPNKKTLRHFQCRDYLWETFEQMSAELECSVDYLINESMRQYSRSRNQGARGTAVAPAANNRESGAPSPQSAAPPPSRGSGQMNQVRPPATAPGRPGAIPSVPSVAGAPAPRIPALGAAQAKPLPTPAAPPPRPPAQAPQIPPFSRPSVAPPLPRPSAMPPAIPNQGGAMRLPPLGRPAAPPLPAQQPAEPAPGAVLYAIYQGERYPVMKEEFVIGRGQKTSDLVIKDSNVSRRHAIVVLHHGQYWIVDQQSTNGVEFLGGKVDRKRIEEGDVFKICDYEIVFTYR